MSRLPEIFENPKYYTETFRDSYLNADSQKIVLAYKVHLVLNSPMKRLEERAPSKLAYPISKARNLVWALLIQGLFNDPQLDVHLDRFGSSLAKETDFRDLLMKIASKLIPIFRDVLADERYSQKMESEKYSFLRTKEIFRCCMDAGYDKYGWTKRSL